ncbi:MAG: DUF3794 domain-containing protein [Clostridium sp.]|nr:DUF3794 domain-containing protein [Clostridium sp.]
MSMEIIRETAKISYVVGGDSIQTIVEHDIIVPDINPDVARVLLLDGEVLPGSSDVSKDRVNVDAAIRYKILYVSDEETQSVKSINTTGNFSFNTDIPGSGSGMRAKTRYEIEHMDYNILNGRKIGIKTILKASVQVLDQTEQDFIIDFRDEEGIQVLKDNMGIHCYLGEDKVHYTAEEELEIPAGKPSIKEILRTDVKIMGKDYRTDDNKIIAKGDINILTLYTGDNEEGSIQFMEHEIPFTQFIDLPGVGSRSECDVEYKIKDYSFNPQEDSDGELRLLRGEITVELDVWGTDRKDIEIITDAYALKSNIDYDRHLLKTDRVSGREHAQISLKEIVDLEGKNPAISEVFNVLYKPNLFEYTCRDGYIEIQGAVECNILYLANNSEQPVFSYGRELPFAQKIELEGITSDRKCEIDMEIEHSNYSMLSESEVEVRVIVAMHIKAIDQVNVSYIANVRKTPLEDEDMGKYPSITIYFTQPDDSLWNIAKKYRTTVEDLCNINELSPWDSISVGRQIIIPKKTG